MAGTKRMYSANDDAAMLAGISARKRRRVARQGDSIPNIPSSQTASTRRRMVRVRRTPFRMDIDSPARKRNRDTLSVGTPKRARRTPLCSKRPPRSGSSSGAHASPKRSRANPAQPKRATPKPTAKPAPAHASTPTPRKTHRPRTRVQPFVDEGPIEEIIAEGAGSVPERTYVPPTPSVNAALMEDGRVAVRVVRKDGIMQCLIIDPPEWSM